MSKYAGIVEDQKVDGKWIQSLQVGNVYYQTRSGQLYRGIKSRVGKVRNYETISLNFTDFQDFCEFCQASEFYHKKDRLGKYYQLDKDVIGMKSRCYSKETCLFIPAHLNTAMKGVNNFLVDGTPCGVSFYKRDNKYRSYCNDGNYKQIHLGFYDTQEEAQLQWRKEKSLQLQKSLKSEIVCPITKIGVEVICEMLWETASETYGGH